jgi:hypothetical protein
MGFPSLPDGKCQYIRDYPRVKEGLREIMTPQFSASCGEKTDSRLYCEDCWPGRKRETADRFRTNGSIALQEMRSSGNDRSYGEEAARLRSVKLRHNKEAIRTWDDNNYEVDGIDFERDMLPGLQISRRI